MLWKYDLKLNTWVVSELGMHHVSVHEPAPNLAFKNCSLHTPHRYELDCRSNVPQKAVCPGHVWCARLCTISCTRAVATWNHLSENAWGADLHRSWVRAGTSPGIWWDQEREGNWTGIWGRVKDWDTMSKETGPGKWSGWGKWDQGVRLGLGLWRRLCLGGGVISPSWSPVWHSSCIA